MKKFSFDKALQEMLAKNHTKNIVILGHMNPDGDAVGSVMGLAHYIRMAFPEVTIYPYLADNTDKGPRSYIAEDAYFDPFIKPIVDHYIVICCDTATVSRIIGVDFYENALDCMVIDHHLANEHYGSVNHVVPEEACSKLIYDIIDSSLVKKEKEDALNRKSQEATAADYFYLGMIHDTSCFQRVDSSFLRVASDLLGLGVDHKKIRRTRHADTIDDIKRRYSLLDIVERRMDGKIAFIFLPYEEACRRGITFEDIHPVAEILRECAGVEAGFTMFEEAAGSFRCSFRSHGDPNVNDVVAHFGGGGHAGAAGIKLQVDEKEAKEICEKAVEILTEMIREKMQKKES